MKNICKKIQSGKVKDDQSSWKRHIANHGASYGVAILILSVTAVLISIYGRHVEVENQSKFASGPSAHVGQPAESIESMSPKELGATIDIEFQKQAQKMPVFNFDDKVSSARIDPQHFYAAPQVAAEGGALGKSMAEYAKAFQAIADEANIRASEGSNVQAEVSDAILKFEKAAAERLRVTAGQIVTSANIAEDGRAECTFSAPAGSGLVMISASGATIQEACLAAAGAPGAEIRRTDFVPQQQR